MVLEICVFAIDNYYIRIFYGTTIVKKSNLTFINILVDSFGVTHSLNFKVNIEM